jgi:hypothetical protein
VKKVLALSLLIFLSACCNCIIRSPKVLGEWQAANPTLRSAGVLNVEAEDISLGEEKRTFKIVEEVNGSLILKLNKPLKNGDFLKLTPVYNTLKKSEVLCVEFLKESDKGMEIQGKILLEKI